MASDTSPNSYDKVTDGRDSTEPTVPHSGHFDPATEVHPTGDFDNTKPEDVIGILTTPEDSSTLPENIREMYELDTVLPPPEHRFPKESAATKPRRNNRGGIKIAAGMLAAAVAGAAGFSLASNNGGNEREGTRERAVSTSEPLPETDTSIVAESVPTTEVIVNERTINRESMTANTPEEWLEKSATNWYRALNYGDPRYIEHMYAPEVSTELQVRNINEFAAKKAEIGPSYMFKGEDVVSIDEVTGFDDPNSRIRSMVVTTDAVYSMYSEDVTWRAVREYRLVRQDVEGESSPVWLIEWSNEISREQI